MHHGTILYDSDLSVVGKALVVSRDKIESKGLKSVRSRVANVKSFMREDLSVEGFMGILREAMFREFPMIPYDFSPEDHAAVQKLQHDVYETWDWNYGRSPAYNIAKERRVDGVGTITAHMNVERGILRDIAFSGDYFGNADASALSLKLTGCRMETEELSQALKDIELDEYFHNLDKATFLSILTR